MKQEITEAAIKWWDSMPFGYRYNYNHNNRLPLQITGLWIQEVVMKWWNTCDWDKYTDLGTRFPTNEEIATIYLKENKEPVSNLTSGMTVQNPTSYAKDIAKKELGIKEPPNVSVEGAATDRFNNTNFFKGKGESYCYNEGAKFGSNWQKEQDKLLVEDMLDVIRMFHATMTTKDYTERAFKAVESAITRAEQYLTNK